MRTVLFALALIALAGCRSQEPAPRAESPRAAIEAELARSAAGWNAGDTTRFMDLYSPAPDTSFVGPNGVIRGKPAIAAHYAGAFAFDDPAKRGTLSIETLDFRQLGADHALLIGRYRLRFADGKDASGITSIVFRREAAGWKLIADHSN